MYGKEYQHDGKTYRLVAPDADALRKIRCCQQRAKVHLLNNNASGPYEDIAEIWAIQLGIPVKEAAELPFRLFIEIMRDCEKALEAYKKAFGQ